MLISPWNEVMTNLPHLHFFSKHLQKFGHLLCYITLNMMRLLSIYNANRQTKLTACIFIFHKSVE
jgi:hypothetical protein